MGSAFVPEGDLMPDDKQERSQGSRRSGNLDPVGLKRELYCRTVEWI